LFLDYSTFDFNSNNKNNITLNSKNLLDKGAKSLWQKKEQEQQNNIRLEKESLKRDMDYVKTLNNWESSFLPKIK
jgi:hypothetical protein